MYQRLRDGALATSIGLCCWSERDAALTGNPRMSKIGLFLCVLPSQRLWRASGAQSAATAASGPVDGVSASSTFLSVLLPEQILSWGWRLVIFSTHQAMRCWSLHLGSCFPLALRSIPHCFGTEAQAWCLVLPVREFLVSSEHWAARLRDDWPWRRARRTASPSLASLADSGDVMTQNRD